MFKKQKQTHTRKISPLMGMFGLFGFLGFLGFLEIYHSFNTIPFPLFFFSFFGFFGLYYEGKMSNTLIDERFELNSHRASAVANRVSMLIIIIVSIFSMTIFNVSDAYIMVSILIGTIGFSLGLSLFLQQFLLYRFENEE